MSADKNNKKTKRQSQQQQRESTMSLDAAGKTPAKKTSTTSALTVVTIKTQSNDDQDPVGFLLKRGYKVTQTLGEGAFARVFKAVRATTTGGGSKVGYAIKVFNLEDPNKQLWVKSCLKNEMFIAKYVKHPNIIFTYDVFKTSRNGYIVMQLASGGDLSSKMYSKLKRPYTEAETRKYFKALMSGIDYMHTNNLTHRDLKLENFLLTEQDNILICDFGFAALATKYMGTVLSVLLRNTPCGTPGYMAPELYQAGKSGKSYDSKAVDIYAMGVCLFEMLNMAQPYPADNLDSTMRKIIRQEIRYGVVLPAECRNLIASMLCVDPGKRLKSYQVVQDKWLEPSIFTTVLNNVSDLFK